MYAVFSAYDSHLAVSADTIGDKFALTYNKIRNDLEGAVMSKRLLL